MTASIALAALAQCPSGPKGDLCLAENGDMRAMYRVAREAYLEGRKTGDFSEANLSFGYTVRNLITLQAFEILLDELVVDVAA